MPILEGSLDGRGVSPTLEGSNGVPGKEGDSDMAVLMVVHSEYVEAIEADLAIMDELKKGL
jgi:hypothetical protein